MVVNNVKNAKTEDIVYGMLESAMKRCFARYTTYVNDKLKNEITINKSLPELEKRADDEILQEHLKLISQIYDAIIHSLLDFINTSEKYNDTRYKEPDKPSFDDVEVKMDGFLKNIRFDKDENIRILLRRRVMKEELNILRYLQVPIKELLKEAKQHLTEVVYPVKKHKISTYGINGAGKHSDKYRLIRESLNDKAARERLIEEHEGIKK